MRHVSQNLWHCEQHCFCDQLIRTYLVKGVTVHVQLNNVTYYILYKDEDLGANTCRQICL